MLHTYVGVVLVDVWSHRALAGETEEAGEKVALDGIITSAQARRRLHGRRRAAKEVETEAIVQAITLTGPLIIACELSGMEGYTIQRMVKSLVVKMCLMFRE